MILVSRVLAAVFVLSAATEIFSPYVSPCKALSESHWASNFHQASLGTNLNLKVLSSLSGMQKVQDPIDVEGKAGTAPTIEELAVTLRSHDLFIYFGHGRGLQFIPAQGIQKLQNCAGTLLMGCSSGSLSLNGSYTPQGAPLCYLLAGSPVIVANLWEVTDKDIDRFAKAIFDCCLEERLTDSLGCIQRNLVTGKFNSMKITGTKGNAKKKTSRKTVLENLDKSL